MLSRGYRVLDFKMCVDISIFVVACGGRSMDQDTIPEFFCSYNDHK